jgi:hypothetical protein
VRPNVPASLDGAALGVDGGGGGGAWVLAADVGSRGVCTIVGVAGVGAGAGARRVESVVGDVGVMHWLPSVWHPPPPPPSPPPLQHPLLAAAVSLSAPLLLAVVVGSLSVAQLPPTPPPPPQQDPLGGCLQALPFPTFHPPPSVGSGMAWWVHFKGKGGMIGHQSPWTHEGWRASICEVARRRRGGGGGGWGGGAVALRSVG